MSSKIAGDNHRSMKRKAGEFEAEFKSPERGRKRVSFAEPQQISQPSPRLSTSDSFLSSLNPCDDSTTTLENEFQAANNSVTELLTNLSHSLGLTHDISLQEINDLNRVYLEELQKLQELEAEKDRMQAEAKDEYEKMNGDLLKLKEQERNIQGFMKGLVKEEKQMSLRYDGYKQLLGFLGICWKRAGDDFKIEYKKSSFNITPAAGSYLITPIHDSNNLFTKGTHKICRSQLKYLSYRLLGN